MHRRDLLNLLGASAFLPGLAGCRTQLPLTLGIHPWIGYETIHLAKAFNWLPSSLKLQEGRNASLLLAALRGGELDAACLTLDEALRVRGEGIPLAVGLVFDASAGADALLARPTIARLQELAGKRLGLEQGALGALMLAKVLEVGGLKVSDLHLVDLPWDRHAEAWQKGMVDAVITFEPVCTLLQQAGARVLFDSRQIPETVFDVLAVRTDRAQARHRVLKALVAGHFKALDHLQTNRQDAVYRIAARQGIQPEEVNRALAGLMLPSLAANLDYLSHPESRFAKAARMVSGVLVRSGLLQREDALQGLLNPAWLPREGG